MKTSDEFVIQRFYKKVNEYLGQNIHRVNEFDFFSKFVVSTICLTYAYLIRAKKSSRFTVRRPHKRRTGLVLVTSLIIRGSLLLEEIFHTRFAESCGAISLNFM